MFEPEKVIRKLAAAVLISGIAAVFGFAYRHYAIWPTDDVITLVRQTKQFLRTGAWGNENQYFKADVSADAPRSVILDRDGFLDGYRTFLVYDTDLGTYSARLLDGREKRSMSGRSAIVRCFPARSPKM